jgi:hypothetical protein
MAAPSQHSGCIAASREEPACGASAAGKHSLIDLPIGTSASARTIPSDSMITTAIAMHIHDRGGRYSVVAHHAHQRGQGGAGDERHWR